MTSQALETYLDAVLNASPVERRQALRDFYRALLNCELCVPNRKQSRALSHSPHYPNDLVGILGIQDGERVISPAFTRPEFIEAWFGSPLTQQRLGFMALVNILPEGWWVCVNPGQDAQKELSPWELGELRRGAESAIEELVEDAMADEQTCSPIIRNASEADLAPIQAELLKFGESHPLVMELRAAIEEAQSDAPGSHPGNETILIGLTLADCERSQLESAKETLQALLNRLMIGDRRARVVAWSAETNQSLLDLNRSLFSKVPPLFHRERPGSREALGARLRRWLTPANDGN